MIKKRMAEIDFNLIGLIEEKCSLSFEIMKAQQFKGLCQSSIIALAKERRILELVVFCQTGKYPE